jgi:type I restriction enzyme, S subunit
VTLPTGWVETKLGELSSKIGSGATPRGGREVYGLTCTSSATGTGYRYIRITDIQDRAIDWRAVPFADEAEPKASSYEVSAGDILFARTGATVGKSYLVTSMPVRAVFASYLIRIRCAQNVLLPSFASWFFQSPAYWQQIFDGAEGTGQPNFNGSKLGGLSLSLPPLAEQRRIVAKLDTLTARLRRARTELDRVAAMAKRIRAAARLEAMRGKLLDRATPRMLLEGLPREFAEVAYPSDWRAVPIIQAAENLDNLRVPIKSSDRAVRQGAYPYYGASGVIDTFDSFIFEGEHLLIGEDGANLLSRSTPIAFLASGQFWVNNHAHILKARSCTTNSWLRAFVNAIDLAPYVSGSAQPKLTQANLNKLVVPMPSLDEQNAILSALQTAFARADRLEAEAARARALLDRLEAAILARAFRGDLVPQDPTDEPATTLLNRIRETRAATPKPKRGRRAMAEADSNLYRE